MIRFIYLGLILITPMATLSEAMPLEPRDGRSGGHGGCGSLSRAACDGIIGGVLGGIAFIGLLVWLNSYLSKNH
jgi:hypothetical protein